MGRRMFGVASLIGLALVLGLGATALAQSASEVLLLTPIGNFNKIYGGDAHSGKSGIVGGASHFDLDHTDTMYTVSYVSDAAELWVDVQVTLHSSSQWLGHEAEGGYRRSKDLRAVHVAPNPIREIDGNKIWYTWGYYTWMSGNRVIEVQHSDRTGTKPEPIEIVRAYLAKYPSSITLTNEEAKSTAHTETWLKNEMERRVWLMEKWVSVGNADILKQRDAASAIYGHAKTFIQYRQKYLGEDPEALLVAFRAALGDWAKLADEVAKLRVWWDANKGRSLTL